MKICLHFMYTQFMKKRNKKNYLGIILLSIILICCHKTNYNKQLKFEVNRFLSREVVEFNYIVLIPGSGCTGCISSAERYFIENVNNAKIKFIFTMITSRKELELRLGKENSLKENVYFDISNQFYLSGYEEKIYPYIMTLSNNRVTLINKLG